MKQEYIDSKEKQIRKLDRKKLPVFIIFMAASLIVGFLIGMVMNGAGDLSLFTGKLAGVMAYVCPAALAVMNIVCAAAGITALRRLTAKAKAWDGDDEEYIEKVEDGLSRAVEVTNIVLVLNYCLFATSCYLLRDVANGSIISLVSTALFMSGMAAILYIQHGALKTEQLINPEKQGSLFSFNFNREQEQSFDEAEMFNLYKAAYKARSAVNMACQICWLLAFISEMMFSCGVLPVMFVSAIWLTSVTVMSTELRKLEKKGAK